MSILGFPKYQLFEEDGTTLVFQFPAVINDTGAFTDANTFVEHLSLRGSGSLISPGCPAPFAITLTFPF